MKPQRRPIVWASIALALVASTGLGWSVAGGFFWNKPIDFEFTGRVIDAETNQPIGGAFVMAEYRITESNWAANLSACIKTRGMTTGKDGRFRFKIDKLDGGSPLMAYAIKPGHFLHDTVVPSQTVLKKQNKESYSNRDISLQKQDPAKPNFRLGMAETCWRAKSKEDAEANIQYLMIELAETEKFGGRKEGIAAMKETIESLREIGVEKKKVPLD